MENIGYIYLVTNKINNKKYIGKRKKSVFDKNYYGSGKYLINALNKYGKENFLIEILDWAKSEDELNNLEKYYIEKYNCVDSNDYYNLKPGGIGGCASGDLNGAFGKHWYTNGTEQILCYEEQCPDGWYPGYSEARKNIAKNINLGVNFSQEHKDKISLSLKNNPPKSMLGKHHSDAWKLYMSNLFTGRSVSEEVRIKISESLKEYYKHNNSVNEGRKFTEEHKAHLSESHVGLKYPNRKKNYKFNHYTKRKGTILVNDGKKYFYINPELLDEYLFLGYKKGRIVKPTQAPNKGKICINNGINNKYIDEKELDYYLSLGYIKGRVILKNKNNNAVDGDGAQELYEEFEENPFS